MVDSRTAARITWQPVSPSKKIASVCILSAVLAGCSQPQPFQRGQQISMGAFSVSFSHAEMRDYDARRALVVHFRCDGAQENPGEFLRHFLTAFKAKDSNGKSYRGLPITAQAYQHMQGNSLRSFQFRDEQMSAEELESLSGGLNVSDWVAVFAVPVEAQGFKLYVRNLDRRDGQPDEAVVDLGR